MSILDIERQEGRQEGELIGVIRTTQKSEGKPITPRETLASKTLAQLRTMLKKLDPDAAALAC